MLHPSHISNQTILICVLNWGLGHASRSLALANLLINQNNKVILASDGAALKFLQENSNCSTIALPDTPDLKSNTPTIWRSLLINVKQWNSSIKLDNQFVNVLVKKFNVQLLISDGRLGCFSTQTHSILLNHQLRLIAPPRLEFGEKFFAKLLAKKMNKFHEIYVPAADETFEMFQSRMSKNPFITIPICPIKLLSRLPFPNKISEFDDVVIVSSKKPLGELFVSQLLSKYPNLLENAIWLIDGENQQPIAKNVIQNPTDIQLSNLISGAKRIFCTCGFSTLMDIAKLNPTVTIVPFPSKGQTEQEFLAKMLLRNNGVLF